MVKKTVSLLGGLLLLCLIIFTTGFMLGTLSHKYSSSLTLLDAGKLALESAALEYALIQNYDKTTCSYFAERQSALGSELGHVGRALSEPTIKNDMTSEEYDLLKRKYHLMQIHSYLQTQQLTKICNQTKHTILFYYDDPVGKKQYNENPEYYDTSKEQGLILDGIVQKLGEQNISIYAIELNYAPELQFLQRFYDIYATPALVINYRYKLSGLASQEDIITYLEESQKNG